MHEDPLRLLPDVLYNPLYFAIDVMNLVVLLMILWAVARRTLVRTGRRRIRGGNPPGSTAVTGA